MFRYNRFSTSDIDCSLKQRVMSSANCMAFPLWYDDSCGIPWHKSINLADLFAICINWVLRSKPIARYTSNAIKLRSASETPMLKTVEECFWWNSDIRAIGNHIDWLTTVSIVDLLFLNQNWFSVSWLWLFSKTKAFYFKTVSTLLLKMDKLGQVGINRRFTYFFEDWNYVCNL